MRNKFFCSLAAPRPVISQFIIALAALACIPGWSIGAHAADAPQWMHAVVNAPLPPHDEKTDAALLYSETNVNVISADKIKTVERRVYKILRPDGRAYGEVAVPYSAPWQKINGLRGWCIPAQGKDYEIKDKEAIERAYLEVEGGDLISDLKVKFLRIPASDPGNIVGYEYEVEENPIVLQDEWFFQRESPARESRYSLSLPSGWEYKSSFLNYPEIKPTQTGNNQWLWAVNDVKGVRWEQEMPPMRGLLGQMIVSFFPPGGLASKGFANWQQM